jgi:hypothetical protein
MAESFSFYWPPAIQLTVYTEGFAGDLERANVRFEELDLAAPWLGPWQRRYAPIQVARVGSGKSYDMRFDAIRFSYKVAAIGAADRSAGVLIWIDADTVTHATITLSWLARLFPSGDLAWLEREAIYPECGFMMFRLPGAEDVIRDLLNLYQSGRLFALPQWHDSYAIETIASLHAAGGKLKIWSLSGAARKHAHVFANSELSTRMDHFKGPRKAAGRTPKGERVARRDGGRYWE